MQALDGIAKARGSYSADALFLLTDENDEADTETGEKVAKLHTLLSDINTPALEAGNLPDKPNQCVGDARYFSADDIGKKSASPTTTSRIRKICSPMIHTNWSASASLRST